MSYYTGVEYTEFTDDMVLPIKDGRSHKLKGAQPCASAGWPLAPVTWLAAQQLLVMLVSLCAC